ncbi:MAG: tRNA pseudouridine(38-40) synthase TruA [Alistipes sp.]|nr:tRNA pseudouridine(38-40) synthase TruA [Alistipes sp.]
MRVKLIVAYDGTNYCGWQVQPNAVTVESVLNEALSSLLKEDIKVIGASRTDSGVHALGNVAVFDTNTRIPAEKISYALNALLPEDIKIQRSERTADDFHPRHCDTIKTYEYHILNREFPLPTKRYDSIHCYRSLDPEKMRAAAEVLVGTHDFRSFCSVKTQTETTVRTIYSAQVEKQEDMIVIRVRGNGFLYNMVRIIAGTLMEVGLGNITPEQVREALLGRDRNLAGPTAPARGLTLVGIEYVGEEEF